MWERVIGYSSSRVSLWHNHSIVGIHNIPTKGPGLIVWYHGPIPVDYIGLVARIYLETNRRVYSVVDRCLNMMPCLDMFRTHMRYNWTWWLKINYHQVLPLKFQSRRLQQSEDSWLVRRGRIGGCCSRWRQRMPIWFQLFSYVE